MNTLNLAWALSALLIPAAGLAAEGRIVDNIDLPFADDPQVQGAWTSVDFVSEPGQFSPGHRRFQDDLYLKELIFLEKGRTTEGWWTWTKGVLIHHGDKTASKYELKDINGATYMFLEWKSGDYVIRHQKPQYYVLKKAGDLKRDDIALAFVDDPKVVGRWQSVDFVKTPEQFDPAARAWQGELYLKELTFLKNGKTAKPWWTWTKGVLMHSGDRTASKYELKDIKGAPFMFLEWKSGDYVFRGMAPSYYVLKKGK